MPIYELIDEDTLKYQLESIRSMLNAWILSRDDSVLGYAVLCLYEYMVCYSRYVASGKKPLSNTKATVKDIISFINGGNTVANYLRSVRNYVGHSMLYDKAKLKVFLNSAEFKAELNKFSLPSDIEDMLTNCSGCLKLCKDFLDSLDTNGKTVSEVYDILKSKFPSSISTIILADYLGHYIINNAED